MRSVGWRRKVLSQVCVLAFVLGALDRARGMTYREPRIFEVGGTGVLWAIHSTPTFFQNWASTITFRAGDVLQFNKPAPGDIAEIYDNEFYYDGCNTTDDGYTYLWTNDGESVLFGKLRSYIGIHYFIHSTPSDCTRGLQFALTVADVTIPAPPVQPQTTNQLQGRAARLFVVGGPGKIWAVPSNKDLFVNWAANISFRKGDELQFDFNYSSEYEVSEVLNYEDYESCTAAGFGRTEWNVTSRYVFYKFERTGVHYFLASGPVQHCLQGMKLTAFVYCEDGTLCNTHNGRTKLDKFLGTLKKIAIGVGVVIGLLILFYLCKISGGSSGSGGTSRPAASGNAGRRVDSEDERERRPGRAAWDGNGSWNNQNEGGDGD